jgi:hypothetical protein
MAANDDTAQTHRKLTKEKALRARQELRSLESKLEGSGKAWRASRPS